MGRNEGHNSRGRQRYRLYPLSFVTGKQTLPVYGEPMVYYTLSILMIARRASETSSHIDVR